MNERLKELNEVVALFKEDAFYTNSYNAGGITLQGSVNTTTIATAIKNGFLQLPIGKDGWIELENNTIHITLT